MRHLARSEPPKPTKLDWEIIRSLIPYLGAYKGRAVFALSFLILAKVATVSVPLVLREVVNSLDASITVVQAIPLAFLIAYGALRLTSSLFREIQTTIFARVRSGIQRRLSLQVVSHLHQLSLRFHLERKTGELTRDIGRGTSSVTTVLNHMLFNILPTFIELALVSAILFTQYDAKYAIVAVVTVTLYGASTFTLTQWRLKFRTGMNRQDSEANSRAVDALLNFETVKYFGNEEFELERYDESLRKLEDLSVKSQASLSLLNVVQGALIAVGVTSIMIMASQGVVDGDLTIGDLVAVNAFLLQLFVPLGFLGTIYSMLKHALNDMERMFALLEKQPEVVDASDAKTLEVTDGAVEFRDVSFGYDADRQVLYNVSFTIPAGHKVAVVGASGSGKSTLSRLLYRFYDIGEGALLIDGQDIRNVTQASLRSAIGIVPQDTVLFNDTLEFNIRYGRLGASDEEVREAARMAQLEQFIQELPAGYGTVVGERGLKLSGGEKQRVAIARALLANPKILIFDEATSSLDSESEQAIVQALRALDRDRSSLVIAHRLSTIVDADTIVVMGSGHILESGTHDELLALGGQYALLWELQQAEDSGAEL
ncbi:MAG: ATP-binding cassette subfamily B protein [Bradymonadia bacterium]|jgi:ATP-binding cassette subfamily B protein